VSSPVQYTDTGDGSNSSSSSSGEEEVGGEGSKVQHWVQCEHLSCRKWRLVEKDMKIDPER
jgi:hypothetical protein